MQQVAWGGVMVTPMHPQQARFIFVSCDEVTTIDNQSWIFMFVYMMHNCKRFILLNLERLTKGVGDNNLTMIKNNLVSFGVLAYNLMLQENLFALELIVSWFSKVLILQLQNFCKGTCTFPYYSSLCNSHMDKAGGANFELFVLHY